MTIKTQQPSVRGQRTGIIICPLPPLPSEGDMLKSNSELNVVTFDQKRRARTGENEGIHRASVCGDKKVMRVGRATTRCEGINWKSK